MTTIIIILAVVAFIYIIVRLSISLRKDMQSDEFRRDQQFTKEMEQQERYSHPIKYWTKKILKWIVMAIMLLWAAGTIAQYYLADTTTNSPLY